MTPLPLANQLLALHAQTTQGPVPTDGILMDFEEAMKCSVKFGWFLRTEDRDFFAFAQEQGARVKDAVSGVAREGSAAWGGPSFMRSTGNVAFDEWREGELARLEEERRKLAEAERDFAEHIDQLRRARDREEFESFMRGRKTGEGKGA